MVPASYLAAEEGRHLTAPHRAGSKCARKRCWGKPRVPAFGHEEGSQQTARSSSFTLFGAAPTPAGAKPGQEREEEIGGDSQGGASQLGYAEVFLHPRQHTAVSWCLAPPHPLSRVMAGSAVGLLVLSALPLQLSSFVLVPTLHSGLEAHNGQRTSPPCSAAGPRRQQAPTCFSFSSAGAAAAAVGPSPPRMTRRFPPYSGAPSSTGPLGIGMGDCPSEDECEIVYDDDEDEELPASAEPAPAPAPAPNRTAALEETPLDGASNSDSDSDSVSGSAGHGKDGSGEQPVAAAVAAEGGRQTAEDLGAEREGLEHREKVLDDGYEKQDMVKWRDAEVVENRAASADDRCRLLTLSLVRHEGLEHDFSRATWLDNYKVPGQFVGIRLDEGGDGGVAGCLVAVSTEPLSVRRNDGAVQVLVTEEASFRLKGDTRGPAEEAKGRSLAALENGDRVKMSDFMGRGFASLFVGWIGLQSALQEQRDIVIVASGARGLGSVKPVLDWPPVQAHAGIKKVSVFLESESPDTAPFLGDFGGWRSSGIRVTQCFTDKTNENPVNVEAAIFSQGSGLAGAVGGNPGAASFLMAGLPGKRAMELTDRLTDHGVDPSRLLFNDFF